jgi:hypothetical protein
MSYSEIEIAVESRIIEHFEELDENRVKRGKADDVFQNMYTSGEMYGCYLEYNGGQEMDKRPFKTPVWVWSIAGVILLQYDADIEDRLRVIIDRLQTVFDEDHTLGRVAGRVKIVDMADAYIGEINDTPFYFLPFLMEAIERF